MVASRSWRGGSIPRRWRADNRSGTGGTDRRASGAASALLSGPVVPGIADREVRQLAFAHPCLLEEPARPALHVRGDRYREIESEAGHMLVGADIGRHALSVEQAEHGFSGEPITIRGHVDPGAARHDCTTPCLGAP